MNTLSLKEDLYRKQYEKFKLPITKADISYLVDTLIGLLENGLKNDGKVTLRGFGTLRVVTRKGREYNVRGQIIKKNDTKTVTFKPGKNLNKEIKDSEV